jgi:predicted transcriptional regulator
MAAIDLNTTDESIIGELRDGRNIPANIAGSIDRDRHYVQRRMRRLREHGLVENIGNGVYELTETAAHRERDVMKSFGKYAETNIDEAVAEVHEELGAGFEEREDALSGQ